MKLALTLTHKEIVDILKEHLQRKVGQHLDVGEIKLHVRSKQNFRQTQYEEASLIVLNDEAPQPIMPEIKATAEAS